ncbi:TonB family protein [Fibrella aquatilis]|uniref:TonB family protein n=1 Tax=Fibrella aquatilis TaxID=2817059 RepID=A0A939K3N6_9BACT|nr:TonB family protein [Fibrella aquatilis]MBO0934540.1 TonB family protein [Fibrella aquatilis]
MNSFRCQLPLISLFFLSLIDQYAYAQVPVYESVNVDSVAVPRGGYPMLETFLKANVQKPFMAQVANVTGKVYVKAVVEPDGQVADVQVIRGLRPDCDREALRVVRLFTAWKPAWKDGRPVRQAIKHTINFTENESLIYKSGWVFNYFDINRKKTDRIKNAKYVTAMAVDTMRGVPNGDLVVSEFYLGEWNEISRYSLHKERISNDLPNAETAIMISYKPDGTDWFGNFYVINTDSLIINKGILEGNEGNLVQFYKNGTVKYIISNKDQRCIKWHTNGIIQYDGILTNESSSAAGDFASINEAWDSTGNQQVKKGFGHAFYHSTIPSRLASGKNTLFFEEGNYSNGLKHGTWIGITKDKSYSYTERFDRGKEIGGEVIINDRSIKYDNDIESGFIGGKEAMFAYLSNNIKYPPECKGQNISGKVIISFKVNVDGSLDDFVLVKGIDLYIDREALQGAKLLNGHWQPAFERGEPKSVTYVLPLTFQSAQSLRNPLVLGNSFFGNYFMLKSFMR